MESPFFADVSSSGYLEDAIAGWKNQVTYSRDYMWQNEENWDDKVDYFLGFTSMELDSLDGGYFINSSEVPKKELLTSPSSEMISSSTVIDQQEEKHSPSSSLQTCMDFMHSIGNEQSELKKIAYPFDMVKRGSGTDGYVTLEDINDRMLMPPTRPIRHPVGDFASHSRISTSGFSLSGKVVIAHAKIHTRGTGSITVIRTKS
ncbi:hypothetical protein LguiB_032843 [Lonicera macranthoides]